MRKTTTRISLVLVLAMLLQLLPGICLVPAASAAETMIEVLYEEDFDAYTGDAAVTLEKGKTIENWSVEDRGSGTFELKDGAMYITNGTGNAHIQLDVPGSAYWQNYTVEADVTFLSGSSWMGIAYNSTGFETGHQKAGLYGTNGYYINGRWNGWVNDGGANNATGNANSHPSTPHRLKIVTSGNNGVDTGTTSLYAAYYDEDGNLGQWNLIQTVTNISANTWRGSIGIACSTYGLSNAVVDNIKVYRQVDVLYQTDFSEADALEDWTVTNGVTASVADGVMTLVSDGSWYGEAVLNVEGSDEWFNYNVEMDLTYGPNYYFAGVAYNYQTPGMHEKAGVYGNSTSGFKYFLNGRYDDGGKTPNWLQHDHPSAGSANAAFTYGEKFRLKVSTTGQCGWQEGEAALYIAHYDEDGNLGPWIGISSTDNIDARLAKGTAGIITSASAGTLTVDNVVVYKAEVTNPIEPPAPNVAQIYLPDTGITNPPVVGQLVTDTLPVTTGRTPALALVEVEAVDGILSVVDPDGAALATVADFIDTYRDFIIPGFIVDSESEVDLLTAADAEGNAGILVTKNLIDAYVFSRIENADDADAIALVTKAREAWTALRGGVLIPTVGQTQDDWRKLCLTMADDTDVTTIIAQEPVTLDAMSYFNNHAVAVWGSAATTGEVYANIAAGAHGILATDEQMTYDVYESITTTTLSGRPMPITHRGAHQNYGTLSKVVQDENGEEFTFWGYTENSVQAVVASWEYFGVLGSEIDLHTTAVCSGDDETCWHTRLNPGVDCDHTTCYWCARNIVLEHDGNLTTTTNIDDLRASGEPYASIFSKGNNKTAYTLYELSLLTLTGRGNNNVDVEDGHKLATFEDVLKATEDLAGGNYVYYCHIGSADEALFNQFLDDHPQYADNVVIFMDASGIENSYNYRTLTAPVPITFADNSLLKATVDQPELDALEDMILLMNRHNGHYLGYSYYSNTDGDDSFYYQTAARGIVTYHSITDGQSNLSRRHITNEGAVGCLTDDASYVDGWFYAINLTEVPEQVEIDTALNVTATIQTLNGDVDPTTNITSPELGIVTISGPEFVKTRDGWTASECGEAEIVFYYDGVAENASYRVYSEPVTVTVVSLPTGVSLNKTSVSLQVAEQVNLFAIVAPLSAEDKTVTWRSDNEAVATVDNDGVVTAVAKGTAMITVTTKIGKYSAACEITVTGISDGAQAVIDQIDALGEITVESEAAIQAARNAYEALNATEKQQVSNYAKLLAAEQALTNAWKDEITAAEKALEEARQKAAEAQAKADAAEDAAEQAKERAAEAERKAAEAQAEAEDAKNDAAKSEEEKQTAMAEAENARKEAEEAQAAAEAAEEEAAKAREEAAQAQEAREAAEQALENAKAAQAEAEAAAALAKAKLEAIDSVNALYKALNVGLSPRKAQELAAAEAAGETAILAAATIAEVDVALSNARVAMEAAVAEDSAAKFSDIQEGTWYYDAVEFMSASGYMNGTSDTTFEPYSILTRAQLITVLYRIAGTPEVEGTAGFSDVSGTAYYQKAVAWAVENGIAKGHVDGTFRPYDAVIRQDLAVFFFRFAQYQKRDVSGGSDLSSYKDSTAISPYALEAVRWAVSAGLIKGVSDTALTPKGSANRASIAVVAYRYCTAPAD